jgi:hypothetical protein
VSLAAVAAAVVAGCGSAAPAPVSATIHGVFKLRDGSGISGSTISDSCTGFEGFDDIRHGAQVVVKDQNGTVIGTGTLSSGRTTRKLGDVALECTFRFSVSGLPKATFYSIEVSKRGAQQYSYDKLVRSGWNAALSLG